MGNRVLTWTVLIIVCVFAASTATANKRKKKRRGTKITRAVDKQSAKTQRKKAVPQAKDAEASATDPKESADAGDLKEVEEVEDIEDLDDVEDIEDIEDIEEVGAIEAGSSDDDAGGIGALIGYLHSAAVHAPIAWLMLLVFVDVLGLLLGKAAFEKTGLTLGALSLAAFVPAIVSGLQRLEHMGLPVEETTEAIRHRNLMFIAMALLFVAVIVRWRSADVFQGAKRFIYLVLVLSAALAMAFSAHLGGEMVFGPPPL